MTEKEQVKQPEQEKEQTEQEETEKPFEATFDESEIDWNAIRGQ